MSRLFSVYCSHVALEKLVRDVIDRYILIILVLGGYHNSSTDDKFLKGNKLNDYQLGIFVHPF